MGSVVEQLGTAAAGTSGANPDRTPTNLPRDRVLEFADRRMRELQIECEALRRCLHDIEYQFAQWDVVHDDTCDWLTSRIAQANNEARGIVAELFPTQRKEIA